MKMSAALAAELLGELEPEEAELGAAAKQLAGEFPGLLPLVDVRGDLLGDEPRAGLPQLLVLLAEGRQGRPGATVLDKGHGRRVTGRYAAGCVHELARRFEPSQF